MIDRGRTDSNVMPLCSLVASKVDLKALGTFFLVGIIRLGKPSLSEYF